MRSLLLLSTLLAACARAPHPATTSSAATPLSSAAGDGYYLPTCALCDRPLGYIGEAVDVTRDGRELRFCSAACVAGFDHDPTAGLAHADTVIIRDQSPHYPLTTCLVSGRSLRNDATTFVWRNRMIRVASEHQRDTFLSDPTPWMVKLDKAVIVAQAPTYGMPNKCPVQGDILEGDVPVDFVVANRMIRVCCRRCVSNVRKRPYQYLALIDRANADRAARGGH